jgi:CRP-like cAMP-binding protein
VSLLPDGYVDDAAAAISAAADTDALAAAERRFAGRGSALSELQSSIKSLDAADKPVAGKLVADTKARLAELVAARRPSVSTALGNLAESGALTRRGRAWLLAE